MSSVESPTPAAAEGEAVSRRSLLGLSSVGAAAVAALSSPSAQAAQTTSMSTAAMSAGPSLGAAAPVGSSPRTVLAAPAPQPLSPHSSALVVPSDIRFLLSRITNGYDPSTLGRALALGYNAFLEEQLHPDTIPDGRGDSVVSMFPTLSRTSQDNYVNDYQQGRAEMLRTELRCATILRAAYSSRQLHERMVEFWSDHFSIDHTDSMNAVLKTQDDREVIRRHALGNFRNLLMASARSSAMGFYLGNYRNTSTQPNENYGREIMELHTLGVGHYNEDDVKAVSHCFTGWGFKEVTTGDFGGFKFRPWLHDDTQKVVLGLAIPAGGGVAQGEMVVNLLAARPFTAQFLARKLCRFFLCYEPPQALVDAVANAYMSSGGEIKDMLRVVFAPSSIAQIPTAELAKYKRPFHLMTSILRAVRFQIAAPERLTQQLNRLGHEPFIWPTPNGYPDRLDLWASGEQTRWAFTTDLFSNAIPGVSFDPADVFAGMPKSQLAQAANRRLTGQMLAPWDVTAIQTYVDSFPGITDALLREVMTLTASAPSFQIY